VAPAEEAHFYRNTILAANSRVVTEASSLQEDSAERGDKYPAYGIISYAQNREDILLWRALRDLADGFYIDVGAEDPTQNSVTRAFYERGWHGINVEPVPGHFDKLRSAFGVRRSAFGVHWRSQDIGNTFGSGHR
jgi:hypothetical protein